LPKVLACDEVNRVLVYIEGAHGLMARLLYGTGLRMRECVRCGSRMSSSREGRSRFLAARGTGTGRPSCPSQSANNGSHMSSGCADCSPRIVKPIRGMSRRTVHGDPGHPGSE